MNVPGEVGPAYPSGHPCPLVSGSLRLPMLLSRKGAAHAGTCAAQAFMSTAAEPVGADKSWVYSGLPAAGAVGRAAAWALAAVMPGMVRCCRGLGGWGLRRGPPAAAVGLLTRPGTVDEKCRERGAPLGLVRTDRSGSAARTPSTER